MNHIYVRVVGLVDPRNINTQIIKNMYPSKYLNIDYNQAIIDKNSVT